MSGDFWGSQEGCQGPSRPSGRNRGLPLRRRRGHRGARRRDRPGLQRSMQARHGPGPGRTEQGHRRARRHATAQGQAGQSRAAEEHAGMPRPRQDRAGLQRSTQAGQTRAAEEHAGMPRPRARRDRPGPQRSMQARHSPGRTEQGCRVFQYCFCFTSWFFGPKAFGSLAPRSGIEPAPCIRRAGS